MSIKKTACAVAALSAALMSAEALSASMMKAAGVGGYNFTEIHTIGETISGSTGALNPTTAGDYTPVGVLDGLGAYMLNDTTVRVLANHELLHFRGNTYAVSDGAGGTFSMPGARISYFDIDKATRTIVDAGIAYDTIYDANGNRATDTSFLTDGLQGFSRFCSANLAEAHEFGNGRGLENRIFFAGEEDGGNFNPIGGGEWALDPATGELWQLPALGRGAWENITELDTGTTTHVALLLADDSSPFDADGISGKEAAPLFLYVGEKDAGGDFPAQNGLRGGKLHVWVSDTGDLTPLDFNGNGASRIGSWVELDNAQNIAQASTDGSTGFDAYGYPTQRNLWTQAKAAGAFGFSRPEDVATNPLDGSQAALASTGVDTYAVDGVSGNGADTFGTTYIVAVDFADINAPTAELTILYDGDADVANRALRSPDNLDWADDGFIYVQEDEAEEATLSCDETLFGAGATNPFEAGIVRMHPNTGAVERLSEIDRTIILDPTTAGVPFDTDAGSAGEWESSGILDVSTLFGDAPGSLFLIDVQAHGIEDQTGVNADSRINDGDLVEGGQLVLMQRDGMRLQLLHASDLEGGVNAIGDAPRFAAIVDLLDGASPNGTLTLSAGDNYIPGPFFNASGDGSMRTVFQDVYQTFFNEPGLTNIREAGGRVDISIMNIIGFDASTFGNHEFDAGSDAVETIIEEDVRGATLGDLRWLGAQFPYLSSNLDFSGDGDLGNLFTADILPNSAFALTPADAIAGGNPPKIAQATVVDLAGEKVGVVGATTQLLETISSPSGTQETTGGVDDMAALAAALQPIIDDLADGDDNIAGNADDVDKIVLSSHLQQLALEEDLITRLGKVDIVIAGGSDSLLANPEDRLRGGDTADREYPIVTTNRDGDPAVVVSTDGQYSYVGRLLVDFDANGVLDLSTLLPGVSGPKATDAQGLADLGIDPAFPVASRPELVQRLTTAVEGIVTAKDGAVFGETSVYIDGRRAFVRTEETNMGNLTADANLAAAQAIDPGVVCAHKNGGGIRAEIGEIVEVSAGVYEERPPSANPASGRAAGEVSQLAIENSLRFNNELTLLSLSASDLKEIFEHAVAESGGGNTPGRFPQVSGCNFSFDVSQPAGSRVQSLVIKDGDGKTTDILVADGEVVGDANRSIRMVTLNFLAGGGDGYPFPALGSDRVDTGVGEQTALGNFLLANHGVGQGTPFSAADPEPAGDLRIQQIEHRADTLVDDALVGTDAARGARDTLVGTAGDDTFVGGLGRDSCTGNGGADRFVFTSLRDAGDTIVDFQLGSDKIVLTALLASLGYTGTDPISDGWLSLRDYRGGAAVFSIHANGTGRGVAMARVNGVTAAQLSDLANFEL